MFCLARCLVWCGMAWQNGDVCIFVWCDVKICCCSVTNIPISKRSNLINSMVLITLQSKSGVATVENNFRQLKRKSAKKMNDE